MGEAARRFSRGASSYVVENVNVYADASTLTTHYTAYYDSEAANIVRKLLGKPQVPWGCGMHILAFFMFIFGISVGGSGDATVTIVLLALAMTLWFVISYFHNKPIREAQNQRFLLETGLADIGPSLWESAIASTRTTLETNRERQRQVGGRSIPLAPHAQPFGVSHRGAEVLVSEWMKHLGEERASVTQFTADGGIDVVSPDYIAQVKNYGETQSVGVPEVRELAGVSLVEQKRALFFTSGRYTSSAIQFADSAGVALFCYSAEAGELIGVNGVGQRLRIDGL